MSEKQAEYRFKRINSNKVFKWIKCKRKNGTEFLKLIWYGNDVNGYVEVGRFNMTKSEYVNSVWNLNDIYEDLKD